MSIGERLQEGVAPWRESEEARRAVVGWVRESLTDISDPDKGAFVAERNGEVVGFVCVSERSHFTGEVDAYIGELVVSKAAEGGGVGRARVGVAEDWGRARGRKRVVWIQAPPTRLLVSSMPLSGMKRRTSRSAGRSVELRVRNSLKVIRARDLLVPLGAKAKKSSVFGSVEPEKYEVSHE